MTKCNGYSKIRIMKGLSTNRYRVDSLADGNWIPVNTGNKQSDNRKENSEQNEPGGSGVNLKSVDISKCE